MPTKAQSAIAAKCDAVKALLIAKNKAYGNSALEPLSVASQASAVDLIAVRIDDKLSRIRNAGGLSACMSDTKTEDTVQDLIGYLLLAQIAHDWEG